MNGTVNPIIITLLISLIMSIVLGYFSKFGLKELWIAAIIISILFFLIQLVFPFITYTYSCSVKDTEGWWTDCGGSIRYLTINISLASLISSLLISPSICRGNLLGKYLIIAITTSIIFNLGTMEIIH
jgi:energy-coupling factor transporter transmembrane protein EcfT